jgi:hypothetical protein
MHGTSFVNSIGKFDSSGYVEDFHYSSNGCIRNSNLDFERMISKVIKNSEQKNIVPQNKNIVELIDRLKNNKIAEQDFISKTTPGISIKIILKDQIQVSVYYRLWNIIQKTDSTIAFAINPDIYNYLEEKRTPRSLINTNKDSLSAYKYEHFERDLQNKKILLNKNEQQILWKRLKDEIKKNKIPNKKVTINFKK